MTTARNAKARLVAASKLVAGIAVLAAVVVWLAPSVDELLARVEPDGLGLALGLSGSAAATAVTAARWKLLTEGMGGTRLPYGAYVYALALTRFLGQVSSNLVMDLVGRGAALRSAGSERGLGHLMLPVLVERLADVVLPAVMLLWIIMIRTTGSEHLAWPSLAVVILVFALLAVPGLRPAATAALALYGWMKRDKASASELSLDLRVALRVVVLSVARYVAVLGQFWGMGMAAGVVLPALSLLGAAPVAMLTALVGITPGGLGLQEAGWAGALLWLGHDATAVAVFVLATRIQLVLNFGVLSLIFRPWRGSGTPRI
jgi:hypothetical protein